MAAEARYRGGRRLISNSSAETESLGAEIAAGLRPGDLVLLSGELGSGKTTLIRGACRALGVEAAITSPTFTIGQRYRATGGLWVSHLDLYRLAGLEGEDPALLDDYLNADSIAFLEWPGAAGERLFEPALEVRLEHAGGDRREIELLAASPRK